MKMTSHKRQPKTVESGISQQPLIGSNLLLKLKLMTGTYFNLLIKTTVNGKRRTSDGKNNIK